MSFRDMNSRLKDFRSWAAASRKMDPSAMLAAENENVRPSMLITESELRSSRQSKTQRMRDSLWEKACTMLEAKREERDSLKEQLVQKTSHAQTAVLQHVTAAAAQEEERLSQVRQKRARLESEVGVIQGQLASVKDKVHFMRLNIRACIHTYLHERLNDFARASYTHIFACMHA
jgi:hypothetical protein